MRSRGFRCSHVGIRPSGSEGRRSGTRSHRGRGDDVRDGDREHACDERVEVLPFDRVDQETPDPRPVEDPLDDDDTAEELPELDAEDRERREQRVGQGVPVEDRRLGETLRPGGADVLGRERFAQALPHEVKVERGGRDDERQERHDDALEMPHRVVAKRHVPSCREPTEQHRQADHEQDAEPELRHHKADRGQLSDHDREEPLAAPHRTDGEKRRERQADHESEQCQLERRNDPLDDGGADGATALLDPEVALDGLFEPDCELHGDRLVEAEPLPLSRDEPVPGLEGEVVPLADPDLRGIARKGAGNRVGDRRDRDQNGEQRQNRAQKPHQEAGGTLPPPRLPLPAIDPTSLTRSTLRRIADRRRASTRRPSGSWGRRSDSPP